MAKEIKFVSELIKVSTKVKCFNCYLEFYPTLHNPICPNCGFCYYCRDFSCSLVLL